MLGLAGQGSQPTSPRAGGWQTRTSALTHQAEQSTKDKEQGVTSHRLFFVALFFCSGPTTAAPTPVHAIRRNWRRSRCRRALYVIQCAVASTPAATGAGLASRLVL